MLLPFEIMPHDSPGLEEGLVSMEVLNVSFLSRYCCLFNHGSVMLEFSQARYQMKEKIFIRSSQRCFIEVGAVPRTT